MNKPNISQPVTSNAQEYQELDTLELESITGGKVSSNSGIGRGRAGFRP
jgi:hypothetical protein